MFLIFFCVFVSLSVAHTEESSRSGRESVSTASDQPSTLETDEWKPRQRREARSEERENRQRKEERQRQGEGEDESQEGEAEGFGRHVFR